MSKAYLLRSFALLILNAIMFFGVAASTARADTVGLTFTVLRTSSILGTTTAVLPGDVAVVSRRGSIGSTQEWRGLTEFNLTGLTPGSATLSFNVLTTGSGTPNIGILAYQGNDARDPSDYDIATFATVGSVSTELTVGQRLSFDVTSAYNFALASGFSSLGFRLQVQPVSFPGFSFNDFRLSGTPEAIPEPATMLLFGTSLAGVGAAIRKRCKAKKEET